MLLEFRVKNCKSFKEELFFSMEPAPKQKGLDYSILKKKIGRKTYKALCSSVVYGANASGKTNIINVMDAFKEILLRGNIEDGNGGHIQNVSADKLMFLPNKDNKEDVPVEFYIKFILDNTLIEYSLHINLGSFLNRNYERCISFEELKINEELIYTVKEDSDSLVEIKLNENFEKLKKLLPNDFSKRYKTECDLEQTMTLFSFLEKPEIDNISMKKQLPKTDIFLMNTFKVVFSEELAKAIKTWIIESFIVMPMCNVHVLPARDENGTVRYDYSMNRAIKAFAAAANELTYFKDSEGNPILLSAISDNRYVKSDVFESYGTIRFAELFPLICEALDNGRVLVMDEFDASMHPTVISSIINLFHNDEINKNGAQLIFNTHNPIFLDSRLFRRDEIKLVEWDNATGSNVYTLADFKTSGANAVRKNENLMKNYLEHQYGAIMDVDLSSCFGDVYVNAEEW
ncbi:MAG: ATP-binding protein [Oscillospiraceae bacterium]|nr:ATP-binding protein [Oscillospiraceae bacterium]